MPVASSNCGWNNTRNSSRSSAVAQAPLGEESGDGLSVHRLVEQLAPGAAAALRAVHRGVGVAQETRGALGRASGDGDSDARGDDDLGSIEGEGLVERLDGALGELDRLLLVGKVLADDDELVASESRHDVVAPDGRGEPAADGNEEVVSGVVAEPVVDDLEPIEVEEEQGHHRLVQSETRRARRRAA